MIDKTIEISATTSDTTEIKKADVLFVLCKRDIICFSNNPDVIGKVLFWKDDFMFERNPAKIEMIPFKLTGDASVWTEQIDKTQEDLSVFLTKFIENNS